VAPPLPTFPSAVLPPFLLAEALLLDALFFSFAFEDINCNVRPTVGFFKFAVFLKNPTEILQLAVKFLDPNGGYFSKQSCKKFKKMVK
jgi:hypothetical protein